MEFLQPTTWADALAAKAATPDAVPIAGGTDVMVELNFARRRPAALLDLTRVRELAGWRIDGGRLRVGAGVTYAELTGERARGGRSGRRRSATEARSAATSARRRRPGTATRASSRPARRSRSPRCEAPG